MRPPLTITYGISVEEIEQMTRTERDGRVRDRLRAIALVASGETVPEVSLRLEFAESALRKWVHRFNTEGPAGLRDRPRSGQPVKLSLELVEDFKERVRADAQTEDGVCALRGEKIRSILAKEYNAEYSLGGTYFLLHRLGFSSLVPRPYHPERDLKMQEEFKKTFSHRS